MSVESEGDISDAIKDQDPSTGAGAGRQTQSEQQLEIVVNLDNNQHY